MIIDQNNAAIVAKVFAGLADQRFTMRTLAGIRKASGDAELSDQAIANIAADLGMRIRRRMRDDAMLVERPVTVDEALAISAKAQNVAAGNAEPFELDYAPLPEPLPAVDVMADVERGLGRPADALPADEDDAFNS